MPNVTYYIDRKNLDKQGRAPIKANISIESKNISKRALLK